MRIAGNNARASALLSCRAACASGRRLDGYKLSLSAALDFQRHHEAKNPADRDESHQQQQQHQEQQQEQQEQEEKQKQQEQAS
ncbi:hypothetical protein Emag_004391 [Eimeria magna]